MAGPIQKHLSTFSRLMTSSTPSVIAFVQFAKTGRGEPDFLNHQCDGSLYRVGFRNGKRHTFAFFAHTYNDKVPCLT